MKELIIGPTYKYKKIVIKKNDFKKDIDLGWKEINDVDTILKNTLAFKGCKIIKKEEHKDYDIIDIVCSLSQSP